MLETVQYVDAVLPGLGSVDTFSKERKVLTSCSAEAPLPPRCSRDIPEETVKGPRLRLVITTFLAMTTTTAIHSFFLLNYVVW